MDDKPRRKVINMREFFDGRQFYENRVELAPEKWERLGISSDDFRKHQIPLVEREKHIPEVGTVAPDFEIERLDAGGKSTGEYFILSSARGKPVALVFGSYT